MSMKNKFGVMTYSSKEETDVRDSFLRLFKSCPIPEDQLLSNLGLFTSSKNMARTLFMHHIYSLSVNIPGVVFDYGTRWGQNLALFAAFRGMYEPFNRHKKLIGFDTFSGFPAIASEDGSSDLMKIGNVSVTQGYEAYLDQIMKHLEGENPLSHIKKYEIRVGNAIDETKRYLEENPHTIISLVYFDFDLYEPTKECLLSIKDRLVKGSVVGFDELNDSDSPGETLALMEVFGLGNIKLKRLPFTSRTSYFVVE